jgi:hypothetical protein
MSRALVKVLNWPPNAVLYAAFGITVGATVEAQGWTWTALMGLLLCYAYAVTMELWRALH